MNYLVCKLARELLRPLIVNMVLCCAVILSVALFDRKHRTEETRLDKMRQTLRGLEKMLPTRSAVVLNSPPEGLEASLELQHIAAPERFVVRPEKANDTVLYIFPKEQEGTAGFHKDSSGRVLWQARDEQFHYVLMVKN